jgi:hypothetical protein
MTPLYQLRSEVKLDYWQVLYLPGKAALLFSRPFILSQVVFLVAFFWGFILAIFVPMSLFVSLMNKPVVTVVQPNIKIVPNNGLFSGWTLPIGDMPWRVTDDRRLILYPFTFLRFAKSAGMKPYRLLLNVPPDAVEEWIRILDANRRR